MAILADRDSKLLIDGKLVAEAPLVALEDVPEAGFFKRLWHELLRATHATDDTDRLLDLVDRRIAEAQAAPPETVRATAEREAEDARTTAAGSPWSGACPAGPSNG